ncbi:hypothetical protein VYF65_001434 [Lysinibacillus irui]
MSDNEKLEQLMAIHTEQLFRIAYYYKGFTTSRGYCAGCFY